MNQVLDILASICFLAACVFGLIAAIGLVRFPDLLTRMHAATKPQVVGLVFALLGLAFRLRELEMLPLLFLVGVFQFATTPIASHMLSRAAFRGGQVDSSQLLVDELSEVLEHDEPRGAP
ncbi:MAG: monovalent cation/H(+) antiporter subunit G [Nocardioidaceae bacterium]|nr:MAG: monovalent cation/H(+) antiporter subunit G [Nocardioidaceae bacterium]